MAEAQPRDYRKNTILCGSLAKGADTARKKWCMCRWDEHCLLRRQHALSGLCSLEHRQQQQRHNTVF